MYSIKGYNKIVNNDTNEVIEINQKEDSCEYQIVDRETEVENLIRYIAESKSESDKYLMMEDLKTLINATDEFIFSSTSTNDYELESVPNSYYAWGTHFDHIAKELIAESRVI